MTVADELAALRSHPSAAEPPRAGAECDIRSM